MSINNVIGLSVSRKMDEILKLAQKQAESFNPDHNKIVELKNHIKDLELTITKRNKEIVELKRIIAVYKDFNKQVKNQLESIY